MLAAYGLGRESVKRRTTNSLILLSHQAALFATVFFIHGNQRPEQFQFFLAYALYIQ